MTELPVPEPPGPARRWQFRFTGRVQGVGFRATTRAIARKHPVTGWVRNESDGSVLAQIQGDPAAVEAVLAELDATMGRNIRHTTRDESPPEPDETAFEITY